MIHIRKIVYYNNNEFHLLFMFVYIINNVVFKEGKSKNRVSYKQIQEIPLVY